ncbi:hypothetical protein ASF79_15150 [Agreia sp. Leaf335]|uniref:hypothetical protein n=1 Tax=Agreia sp. Leaf335 TaxID=1736340 RepID=UPI0006FB1A90|nr:hypothetical protein [Agreia sp. Leaf335]KQR19025.1 hypothetical protein ASF79_15150 [Agreia sp. Leaf335]
MPVTDAPIPPYDGPRGILLADRLDLAARLFVATFLGQKTSTLPRVDLEVVGMAGLQGELAALGGYTMGSFTLLATRQPWAITTQLALECVLIWERASIAARYADQVVVLEPGMRILVSSEPEAAADRAMSRIRPTT